ncbi:MAG: hypothetical protein DRH24_08785, partial [Deltaproteobacteria bacterium]
AGLDALYLDEAAFLDFEVVTKVLLPMLTVSDGPVMLTSTPNGHNWFKDWYDRYRSWHATSLDNPWASKRFIDEQRSTLPEVVFRQEYLAEFVADQNAAIKNLNAIVTDSYVPYPISTIGVDVGRYVDETALVGITETGVVQYTHTARGMDTASQARMIKEIWLKHEKPNLVLDATGYGRAVSDILYDIGVGHEPITLTSGNRAHIYATMITAIERGEISIARQFNRLIEQLRDLQYLKQKNNYRYDHRPGGHDDLVFALALAWHVKAKIIQDVSAELPMFF